MKKTLLFLGTLMLLFSAVALAQEKKVSGKVIAPDGSPVPFANVKIVGTTQGTAADDNGAFIITVKPGAELEISSLGYEKTDIKVGDQSSLTIRLTQNVKGLNTVVVTGLGVKRQEKTLGYSMTEINGDAIREASVVDPTAALQGKVAGVFINQGTGGPTSSNRIQIRGVSTLDPNAQPLIIIDGVELDDHPSGAGQWGSSSDFGNQMKDVNADDIATISVLKGGAATAIYGSKGLNGVILITTKKGRSDKKLGVTVSHTEQWNQVYKFPDFQNIYGAGAIPDTGFAKDPNNNKDQVDPNFLAWSFGPKMQGQTVEDWDGHSFRFSPNNPKDAYQTGRYLNTNVAIDGGNENTTFRFSYSNQKNTGTSFNNSFDRNSLNLRATQKLGSVVDVDAGINFTRGDGLNPARDGGNDNLMFALSYDVPRTYDINYWKNHYIDPNKGGLYDDGNYYGVNYIWFNLFQNNAQQTEDNLRGHLELTAHATDWLDFKLNGYANNIYTTYTNKSVGSGAGFGGGSYELDKKTALQNRLQGLAVIHKKVSDFDLGFTAGAETFNYKSQGAYAYTDGGLIIPKKFTLSNSINPSKSREDFNDYRLNSVYAYANLGWKDQVFLDITGRNDWSSALTYPDGHGMNSYFYPSVSGAWIFTQTFHLPVWFTFGKLRASYAQIGKDVDYLSNPYLTSQGLGYQISGNYSDHNGHSIPIYDFSGGGSLGNLHLKPQISHSVEFGADLKFFENRLGFDIAVYKNNTTNQILPLSIAGESGAGSNLINAGNIQNKGIELLLTGTPVQLKNFQWDISVNFTHNEDLITSLAPGVLEKDLEYGQGADMRTVAYVGKQYGELYTKYAYARYQALDNKGNPVADSRNGMKVLKLRTSFFDGTTQGIYVRSQDYQNQNYVDIGGTQPKFYYGFRNDFTYKGVHLGIALDGRVGGKYVSATYDYGYAFGNWTTTLFGRDAAHGGLARNIYDASGNVTATYHDGIIPEGVFQQGTKVADPKGNIHDVSGMTYADVVKQGIMQPVSAAFYYYRLGSWSTGIRETGVGDQNWLAVREVSLAYDLPMSWIKRLKLSTARVGVYGRNLGYLVNTLPAHMNPEGLYNSNAGNAFEYGGLPYIRNIGFNVTLGM